MNEKDVILDVLRSLANKDILWKVRKAIFEIYPGEYVYLKGEGPIDLDDYYLLTTDNINKFDYENVIISRSLIGYKGQLALNKYEAYKTQKKKTVVHTPIPKEKNISIKEYNVEGIKMAVFYYGKEVYIAGRLWSLNEFLSNNVTADILKVAFYPGSTKEDDCYHILYTLKTK